MNVMKAEIHVNTRHEITPKVSVQISVENTVFISNDNKPHKIFKFTYC